MSEAVAVLYFHEGLGTHNRSWDRKRGVHSKLCLIDE